MNAPYRFSRQGRTPATAFTLAGVYAALLIGLYVFQISPWLIAVLFLFTLPAIWDLAKNPTSGMTITKEGISWHYGQNSVSIDRADIKTVKVNLRLDRSVKLIIELQNGRRIRVTQPSIPPLKHLEREFPKADIPYQKNPFSLL